MEIFRYKSVLLCGITIVLTVAVISSVCLIYLMGFNHNSKICESNPCLIQLPTGYVEGFQRSTVINGKQFMAFKGIPYAEAPIGQLRFKDPLPARPWSGVINGSEANICPQISSSTNEYIGNEDCLFINVYIPQLRSQAYSGLLPVMVVIHGGAFMFGSGDEDNYGPDFLIEENVILVSFNYRLNVLGFLSLGNSVVPGNAGLKDQNLAMRWVHDNIHYFGGDKNKVTLFGISAGGASVHFHTLIPQSSGLFNKVIIQSGSVLNPWTFYNEDPVPCAFNLGNILGFESTNVDELYNFLKEQQAEKLVANYENVFCNKEKKREIPFVPCKEVTETGSNFITEDPSILLALDKYAQIPYIIGVSNKEGLVELTDDMRTSPIVLEAINNDSSNFVPENFCKKCSNGTENIIASKVKKFFFDNLPLSWEDISNYADLETDLQFAIGIDLTLYWLTKNIEVPPIYVYMFSFEGKLAYKKNDLRNHIKDLPAGAAHADDLGYLFYRNMTNKTLPVPKNSPEIKTVKRICKLWSNFAKYSNPNEKSFGVVWETYNAQNPQYLDIGNDLKIVHSRLFENRTSFWLNIFHEFFSLQ